jgi:diaminopimelate decarboxylase
MNISYKNSHLFVENIAVETIAKKNATPFYLYSAKEITDNYKEFTTSLKAIKNLQICYAVKANPNLGVLHLLSQLGSGADTVSQGEIFRSIKAGISPKKIVFSGVGKTRQEIIFALKKGIMQFNVESVEELEVINEEAGRLKKKANIAIRINPNVDAKTHGKITTGRKCDKFGIDVDIFDSVFAKLKGLKNLNFVGISCHIGSQITDIKVYEGAFKVIKKLYLSYLKKGVKFGVIDIGGGIGINYNNNKTINIQDYGLLVAKYFADLEAKIIVEPGRKIVGNAGILITRVILVKHTPEKNFIIIDAGMNDLIRPAMYDAYHEIVPVINSDSKKQTYDIVGPICETSDIFLRDYKIQQVKEGDLLAIKSAGAYGSSMSSTYNSRGLAAEILVSGNKFKIVRKGQDLKDIIRGERI